MAKKWPFLIYHSEVII